MTARFGYTKNMRGGYSPQVRYYEQSALIHDEAPLFAETRLPNHTIGIPPEACSLDFIARTYPPPPPEVSEAA